MEKQVIKKIIIEKQSEIRNVKLIKRPLDLEPVCNYVFIGMRRAGKSYSMYQYILELVDSGKSTFQEILFVNFEDERLSELKSSELDILLESYRELFDFQPIIFLDEIQNVNGWEKFARRLADSKYRVFITGSNANMLSREIHSTLGGRFLVKEIYPFSFFEFLSFHGTELAEHWEFGDQPAKVARLFADYYYFGGFAEVFPVNDKRSWISSLYQKILFGDIIVRNNLRNDHAIRILVKKLAESVMQPMSLTRLKNILASTGFPISGNTLSDYLQYLDDSFLTFSISNYSDKLTTRETFKKRYFSDNGLLNNFLVDPETRLLENLVAISLFRQYGENLFYYHKNIEIDFFVPPDKMAVQVSYNLSGDATRQREIRAFQKVAEIYKTEQFFIITRDEESRVVDGKVVVHIIPIWKWLLRESGIQTGKAV